jgi:hypothetical protein
VELGQPIPHDAANEASGVRHQRGEMLGIACDRLLSSTNRKHFHKTLERCRVVGGDRAVCACVVLIGAKGALGHDRGASEFFVTVEEPKLDKVAGGPAAEFPESLELALVVLAPARRISGFVRSFEFDEGARRTADPDERDIGPTHARVSKLGDDDQARTGGQFQKQAFKQLLERWSECRLWNIGVRSAKLPYSSRVGFQEISEAHRVLLMSGLLHVITKFG